MVKMLQKNLANQTIIIYSVLVLSTYLIILILNLFIDIAPLSNILGFLSLIFYVATLLPSILKIVLPITQKSKILIWLFKYRRYLGLTAFSFGLSHGVLQIIQKQINLLEIQTYIHYFQGFSLLFIFTILAITSNDQTMKSLKQTWKKIQQLSYLVLLLLPWHIISKTKTWTCLTPIAILLITTTACLFVTRKYLEMIDK
jgi:sulfoxide reductase heme-binding subunit YedZ